LKSKSRLITDHQERKDETMPDYTHRQTRTLGSSDISH
jgi:hypothetical protein